MKNSARDLYAGWLAKRAIFCRMFFLSLFPLIFHKDSAALVSALFLSRFEAHEKRELEIAAERSTPMSIRLVCFTRQQIK